MNRRRIQAGRASVVGIVVLVLIAGALLLFYSKRAVPPEPAVPSEPARTQPAGETEPPDRPAGDDDIQPLRPAPVVPAGESAPRENLPAEVSELPPADVDSSRASARLRDRLADHLDSPLLGLVAEEQLVERLVATINSLDGDPVPLRYRPLVHVPGLPEVAERDERLGLPASPDPRYDQFRQMFDRFDADALADEFERLEPALEHAWQQLGENTDKSFRERTVEISRHLADFELPSESPELARPDVLYEYADPQLESLSWGQKTLIRIGPDHARAVQRKLDAIADRLENENPAASRGPETAG